jgi:SOS-response transcriptional repressor LexA
MRGRQVPIVGTIAAGQPIEAVTTQDDYVTVPGFRATIYSLCASGEVDDRRPD